MQGTIPPAGMACEKSRTESEGHYVSGLFHYRVKEHLPRQSQRPTFLRGYSWQIVDKYMFIDFYDKWRVRSQPS